MEWIKGKLSAEKAAIIGFVVTLAWWVNDGVVDGDWSDWRVLVPIATALMIRVFVTSTDVQPGWRRPKP